MYRGVETPWCPIYRGVAKPDPLKIQNSPKYQGVSTPWYLGHQGVETSRCPMYRGVVFCFFEPSNLPLKQHSFKKLPNISIYYTNTVQTCLKIFPITMFLG